MGMLPACRSMRNRSLTDPTREFEGSYQRIGQLMNLASGQFAHAVLSEADRVKAELQTAS
jgi:hypothetical protein